MRAAKVVELDRTCGSCPSQWEGRLDDGRHVFVHYRGGRLTVGVGRTADDAVDASIDNPLVRSDDADGGGWMSDDDARTTLVNAGFEWAVPA